MNEEQGLKNVIAYIETHLKEPLSAEEIAAARPYHSQTFDGVTTAGSGISHSSTGSFSTN